MRRTTHDVLYSIRDAESIDPQLLRVAVEAICRHIFPTVSEPRAVIESSMKTPHHLGRKVRALAFRKLAHCQSEGIASKGDWAQQNNIRFE